MSLQVLPYEIQLMTFPFVAKGPQSLSHSVVWKMWTMAKKTLMAMAPAECQGQKQTSKPKEVNTLLRRASGKSANQLCCAYSECAYPHMCSLAVWCAPHGGCPLLVCAGPTVV